MDGFSRFRYSQVRLSPAHCEKALAALRQHTLTVKRGFDNQHYTFNWLMRAHNAIAFHRR
jgi:hypothetical protein